jgi:hypothetical protein
MGDREECYSVNIFVHDLGSPQRSTTKTIVVSLTDVNDNAGSHSFIVNINVTILVLIFEANYYK